jgi:signal transduction histidine kinase
MEITINCRLAGALAARMREEREDLTQRWLERIAARVTLEPNHVFPTDDLLDHVPILMDGIADYLENPAGEISADPPVVGKAIELGDLRYAQGFDAHEILKEYEILGGVLFAFLVRSVDAVDEPCTRPELLACAQRLFRAVSVIQQVTTNRFLRLAAERVSERENRLRSFNRMVSHELKNRIGAVLGAGQLLEDDALAAAPETRHRFARMVVENAEGMQAVLENLLELSRMEEEPRRQRHVTVHKVAVEVARQLREMARDGGVEVRIGADWPEVEVNAGALELCLTNYLSNAIKYADSRQECRWVEVSASLRGEGDACELVVEVVDNGLGVPDDARGSLFTRFFRAPRDTVTGVEGSGLGLSIVRETMESMGGRAWAEFDLAEGTRFLLSVPCRRTADRHGAGDGERAVQSPQAGDARVSVDGAKV